MLARSKQLIKLFFALVLLYTFLSREVNAQEIPASVGIEFQAYPTGLIPGVSADIPLTGKSALHMRLGYQYIRHRDLGVHDDERGDGYGLSLGWKTRPFSRWEPLTLELRSDLWFNSLDWRDDLPGGTVRGTSEVVVVQPTLVAGYQIMLGGSVIFEPTLGFGIEINVKTEGEDVGEGAILLVGFQLKHILGPSD